MEYINKQIIKKEHRDVIIDAACFTEKIEKDEQNNKQQEKQEEKSSERIDAQTGDYVAIIMLTIFMISCLSLAVLRKKYGTKE